jgi:hypothetical protein
LADETGMMNGVRLHWPNNTSSTFRRTAKGVQMTNFPFNNFGGFEPIVGMYAPDEQVQPTG